MAGQAEGNVLEDNVRVRVRDSQTSPWEVVMI